jgi:microcystin-dependent protein
MGEILLGATDFAFDTPTDGRALQINTNTALFSLLGTRFGGNGITYFNLPDLRGVTPKSVNGEPLIYTICTSGIFPSRG